MPLREIQQQSPSREIKDFDSVVVAPAYETPGDGIDVQGSHEEFVRVDGADAVARVGVPDADDLVTLGVAGEFADAASGLDIPQPNAEIATAAHYHIIAQLHRINRAGVSVQMAMERAGVAVEDGDGAVFGAGDDVFIVERQVQHRSAVVLEAADGTVGVGDGVDDACPVGGAGDEDGGVVLEAEDGGVMVGRVGEGGGCAVAGGVGGEGLDAGGGLGGGDFGVVGWGAGGGGEEGGGGGDGGGADDEEAFVGVDVPDAEGFVAGAGDDFVSGEG
ncbi:hypothetical protein V501_03933 [Pseudogymnoascus sp. VKM F-4519 (FW-2642)]|nr:hypothetical protein V501_03933 [Pseudogymnoascus sp. VKM F-4519 (FW-2642)]